MPKYVIERDIPGAGKIPTDRASRDFAEVVRGLERDGSEDPMGA